MSHSRSIVNLFFSKLFPPLLTFSVFAYTARILTPADFGFFALALSIIMLISTIQPHGWRGMLIKKEFITPVDISTVFYLHLFVAIISFSALTLFSCFSLFDFQSDEFNLALNILSLKVLLDGVTETLNAVLLREQKYNLVALKTVFSSIFSSITILLL
ncbi:MAG: oligosaccharide flippase family protein, partial [Psychromonas sp.]|nr:oligosaccharide flippase family protein [Psychromonas sp.]